MKNQTNTRSNSSCEVLCVNTFSQRSFRQSDSRPCFPSWTVIGQAGDRGELTVASHKLEKVSTC